MNEDTNMVELIDGKFMDYRYGLQLGEASYFGALSESRNGKASIHKWLLMLVWIVPTHS